MTCREAQEIGRAVGFPGYSAAAHSLANHPEVTGVMRVPKLEQALAGDKRTQMARVLEFIDTHGGITNDDAFAMNVQRLSGVIFKLRAAGFEIITIRHPMEKGGTFAEYRLK